MTDTNDTPKQKLQKGDVVRVIKEGDQNQGECGSVIFLDEVLMVAFEFIESGDMWCETETYAIEDVEFVRHSESETERLALIDSIQQLKQAIGMSTASFADIASEFKRLIGVAS